MKLTKYFMPFAALALLASCSDDKVENPVTTESDYTGDVYAKISINLPSTQGSRAITENDFVEGDPGEYAVKSATLYVFKAEGSTASETTATFVESKSQEWDPKDATESDITKKSEITYQLKEVTIPKNGDQVKYYGLVILNEPEGFGPTTGTFSDWNSEITEADYTTMQIQVDNTEGGGKTTYFTMANAPTYTTSGTTKTVSYLVELDPTQFGKEPAEAVGAAGTFYVQRGVAKVTISGVDEDLTPTGTEDAVTFNNWSLDVTNKKTYPVQTVSNFTSFENLGNHFFTVQGTVNNAFTHIWWGTDPNYGSYAADFNILTDATGDNDEPQYCLENLMAPKQMTQNQTTRVLFKATYKLNGVTGTDYSFVVFKGNNTALSVAGKVKSTAEPGERKTLSDIIEDDYLTDVTTALSCNKDAEVDYYKDGLTYYVARIRHFANNEAGDADLTVKTADEYEDSHTGRYGVLRNNWYDVKVNSVAGYGSPNPPTPGDTPDDPEPEEDLYNVKVSINILDWAKRSYDYDLK